MKNWAVDASSRERSSTISAALGRLGTGRKPTIEIGDRAVLFSRARSQISFVGSGVIAGLSSENEESGRSNYFAAVEGIEEFDQPRKLDDFRFSLQKVRLFRTPYEHFRRPYSQISDSDASTLEEGEIFCARTVVGLVAEALPPSARLDFASEWFVRRRRTHQSLAEEILNYMDRRYGGVVRLLDFVDTEAQSLVRAIEQVEEVVLREESLTISVSGMTQAARSVAPIFDPEPEQVSALRSLLDLGAEQNERISSFRGFRLEDTELLRIMAIAR